MILQRISLNALSNILSRRPNLSAAAISVASASTSTEAAAEPDLATSSSEADFTEVDNSPKDGIPWKGRTRGRWTRKGVPEGFPTTFGETYPEFLPHPMFNTRHALREKLERRDMLRRRSQLAIPEFYVGSVLAITASDPDAPGRKARFVGICILRDRPGLSHEIVLRNHIDGYGFEIKYDLYSPLILSVEVLKLERRLDSELLYLRDAPAEYSTFPFDMDPVPHPHGATVPINPIKVKMKTNSKWSQRWHIKKDILGIDPDSLEERKANFPEINKRYMLKKVQRGEMWFDHWKRVDIMHMYRQSIPLEDQLLAFDDMLEHERRVMREAEGKGQRRKRMFPSLGAADPKGHPDEPHHDEPDKLD